MSCYEAGRDGFWLHRYLVHLGVKNLRELRALRGERTRHINRAKGLLASYGIRIALGRHFLDRLESVRLWDGRPLPLGLKRRLVREYERLQMVD